MDFYRCCRNGALLAAGDKVPERQKEKWKPSAAGGGGVGGGEGFLLQVVALWSVPAGRWEAL